VSTQSEDHQIVSHDWQGTFSILRVVGSGPQGGTEGTPVSGDCTADPPAMAIDSHLWRWRPVCFRRWRLSTSASPDQRNHCRTNAMTLAAPVMVVLAIAGGICSKPKRMSTFSGQNHSLGGWRRSVTATLRDRPRGDQMPESVADQHQLRPVLTTEPCVPASLREALVNESLFYVCGNEPPASTPPCGAGGLALGRAPRALQRGVEGYSPYVVSTTRRGAR